MPVHYALHVVVHWRVRPREDAGGRRWEDVLLGAWGVCAGACNMPGCPDRVRGMHTCPDTVRGMHRVLGEGGMDPVFFEGWRVVGLEQRRAVRAA